MNARGFTLIEMLVVIVILGILLSIAVPAFQSIQRNGNVTRAAYNIADTLEAARAHAMAHNTYVWVGFYEEDVMSLVPTNVQPPFTGKGRVILATVASKDGTKIFDDDDTSATLPADRITQVGTLVKVEQVHLADLGAPAGGDTKTLDGRPNLAYTNPGPPNDHFSRISSESADKTKFVFTAQGYTFYKTLRFSPHGELNINGVSDFKRVVEIGLKSTRGPVVETTNPNVIAIQITGIGGNVKLYRK